MKSRHILALLLLAVALSYLPAIDSGLVRDDWVLILRARSVAFAQEMNPFFPGHVEHLRPVRKILYEAMNALFGARPLPYHLLNLLIQFACVLMTFKVAVKFVGERAGLIAAALFALHPGPSEAIIWPAAVATPLSTLFALVALDTAFSGKGSLSLKRALSLIFALLAYLTHESTAPLAAAIILVAWGENKLKENQPILIAHALLAAVFVAVWMLGPFPFNKPVAAGTWRVGAHGFFHIVEYMVSLTLYPGLYLYPHGVGWLGFLREPLWLHVVADLIFAAGIVCCLLVIRRRESAWLVSGMILLLPVAFFTWGNSSRYLHLPTAFWSLAVASITWRLYEKSRVQKLWRAGFVAVLILFAMNDFKESLDYRKEASETQTALHRIEAEIPAEAESVELDVCPMHPDHLAAALRVMRDDLRFQVTCKTWEKLPDAPPRR